MVSWSKFVTICSLCAISVHMSFVVTWPTCYISSYSISETLFFFIISVICSTLFWSLSSSSTCYIILIPMITPTCSVSSLTITNVLRVSTIFVTFQFISSWFLFLFQSRYNSEPVGPSWELPYPIYVTRVYSPTRQFSSASSLCLL